MKDKPKMAVWWIPQIPGKRFTVPVSNLAEAKLLLTTLADYDLFQLENNIKPDYSNAGGLITWDEGENEWIDWENEDGESIDDVMRAKKKDSVERSRP